MAPRRAWCHQLAATQAALARSPAFRARGRERQIERPYLHHGQVGNACCRPRRNPRPPPAARRSRDRLRTPRGWPETEPVRWCQRLVRRAAPAVPAKRYERRGVVAHMHLSAMTSSLTSCRARAATSGRGGQRARVRLRPGATRRDTPQRCVLDRPRPDRTGQTRPGGGWLFLWPGRCPLQAGHTCGSALARR
jgi:hypothetical protein